METQIFVFSSSLSFLNPSTHEMMLPGFSCRGGFHHIGAQTASPILHFRKDVIKDSLLKFFCHLDFRVFCRILLVNCQMFVMDGLWEQSYPSTRVSISDVV